jgi:hypothetical protein
MRVNQACLRWLGAVFRLRLFRPGVLVRRFKKRATFPLAVIPGRHLRVRRFTIIFFDRRNVRAIRFE